MKRLLTVSLTIAMMAFCSAASAGQIWTDGNGDGLPDTEPIAATPSTNVTFGVWLDAQAFTFTNYLAYIEWTGQCISYVSATYVITGGSNFPIDNFSHPRGLGFGGSGFNRGGVVHIGNFTVHINSVNCCVAPIIDIYNPYYVFSQLGAGSAYMLFTTNPGTCYGDQEPSGACCYPDGSCDVQFALDCQAGGGVYQGDGTNCAQVNCGPPDPTGACCFGDSCVIITAAECNAQSGVYFGDNTTCDDANNCLPFPVEACCFPDGACADLTVTDCSAQGGTSQGAGSLCATVGCPQPTGACCVLGGCFEALTLEECNAVGGAWFLGVPCADVCPPDAIESKSWGNIKGRFR
jgi:hypothetical protein